MIVLNWQRCPACFVSGTGRYSAINSLLSVDLFLGSNCHNMEQVGTDFNTTGSVMNRSELEELRRKRGECVKCGQKCFRKKLFKMIPIDDHGKVLNGRCLNCNPLNTDESKDGGGIPAVSRPATREDLARFSRSQSNLQLGGPGVVPRRGVMASHSGSELLTSSSTSRRASASRALLPRSIPQASGRGMGPRSHSMMVEPISRAAASISSHDGSESQALPSPPPQTESSFASRSKGAPPRTVSGGLNGIDSGPGDQSVDGNGSLSSQPSDRGGPVLMRRGGSRRRISATNSGQSLRSVDSSILEDAPSQEFAADFVAHDDDERKPTSQELKRATETILAAKKYGVDSDAFRPESADARDGHAEVTKQIQQYANEDVLRRYPSDNSYQDHTMPVDYDQKLVSHAGSNRSLRSASTLGDRSTDNDEIPRHGVLNRGGEFAFKMDYHPGGSNRQVGTHIVSGSSRTLSSMSSIEEDRLHINGQLRQSSKKHLGGRIPSNPALYEHADEGSTSNLSKASGTPSQTSSRNMSNRSSVDPEPLSEEQYIERIHLAGQELDYRELLIVLREAMNSPMVVKEAFEEISCLQLNGDDHEYLTDLGAPHLIADAMQAHVRVLEVQLWGCGAIWNMTGTIRAQLAFVDAGALDLILAAMDNFLDNLDVQEKSIAALSNLGAAEDNLEFLIDRGAVGRIVEAMNKHSDAAAVQIKGCSAMTNFASHVSPLKRQIMDLGGGGAVVICMVMHPEDFYLQEKALRALRNLCANSEENKIELANIGGIDAVISAMQVHRDEAGVQEEGAWTLSNLAGNDDNKAVIGDCGGIDVIIRAMWVHSDNVGVQEWCCRALFTLTLDTHNGNIVLEVGGISAVVNAMQAHVDSPAVQEMGCAVLGNLAGSDQSKMRIVDEEALDAIVLAMVLFTDDSQLQERACVVLLRLAIAENFKSMHAANIVELVRVAAEKFPDKCEDSARRLLHVLDT